MYSEILQDHIDAELHSEKCPHCAVDTPNLELHNKAFTTRGANEGTQRAWGVYVCRRCGGVVLVSVHVDANGQLQRRSFPKLQVISEDIPSRAKVFLQQALDSKLAPSGCIMLCASAVDAMLKERGIVDGKLYSRIESAEKNHLITPEMALWAHDIRLDANEERHADEKESFPTSADADRVIDFALALGEFLFVLPMRVRRGLKRK